MIKINSQNIKPMNPGAKITFLQRHFLQNYNFCTPDSLPHRNISFSEQSEKVERKKA